MNPLPHPYLYFCVIIHPTHLKQSIISHYRVQLPFPVSYSPLSSLCEPWNPALLQLFAGFMNGLLRAYSTPPSIS